MPAFAWAEANSLCSVLAICYFDLACADKTCNLTTLIYPLALLVSVPATKYCNSYK